MGLVVHWRAVCLVVWTQRESSLLPLLLVQVMDVIKKSGTTTQLGLIVFLMIVLIILAVVAFM